MADTISPENRSKNMASIRNKDTKPEIIIRKALHKQGYRYRTHAKHIPGSPDITLPKYSVAIFVHGCFWHKHDCHFFRIPKSNIDYWTLKLDRNASRDQEILKQIRDKWRIGIVWECAIKGKTRRPLSDVTAQLSKWIHSESAFMELTGADV